MVLAAAVPLMVSVLSLVIWSPGAPLSWEKEAMTGATGAGPPITGSSGPESALTLPATSVAVAWRSWAPVDSAAVVTLQVPSAAEVAVPTSVVPS